MKNMKLLPDAKTIIIAYIIASVLNIKEFFQVGNSQQLLAYFIDNAIYALFLIVVLRIAVWLAKKMGMTK